MEQLSMLLEAFQNIFASPGVFAAIVIGVAAGEILGAIPGLSSTVGIVLILPFSYYLGPLAAISMMYAVHKAGTAGGSITAILMNTPGTAASACTQLDGYPLTRQGKAGKALKAAVLCSAIGDIFSDLVLVFATVYIAQAVWAFGPIQMTAVLFFALTLIATVTGKSPVKGVVSASFGILFSLIGLDAISGAKRFTYGVFELENGIGLIPMLIGLFIVSEVLLQAERIFRSREKQTLAPRSSNPEDSKLSWKEFRSVIPTIGLSSVIGTVIGILPGIGAATAPWIAYGQAKSLSRTPEEFGCGSLKGIAAAETSNNAVCGANLIPLFALGVPGSTDAALMMGVFMINGIEFGPRIFENSGHLVYGIFAAGFLAIAGYFLIGWFLSERIGGIISRIPVAVIYPVILVLSFIGAYADRNSLFDLVILVVFGTVGYGMRKLEFPVPPMIIAFMIGERFESTLRQALLIGENHVSVFFKDPISLFCIVMAALLLGINTLRSVPGITRTKK